jgi:hypothetical protein
MSEDYGIVHYKKFNQGNSISALSAIRDCISAATSGYWEIDGSISLSNLSTQLALKAKSNLSFSFPHSNGNPNDQRIAISAPTSEKLEFAYAPDGWGVVSSFNNLNSTSQTWTGFRPITANNTKNIENTSKIVYVVQYRDNNATTPYPASTLAILLGNSDNNVMDWCAYAGRGITVQNPSDFSLGLFGDCLLVGAAVFSGAGMMTGGSTPVSSVVRTGNNTWHYTSTTQFDADQIKNINDIRRVVPYEIHALNGRAIPTVDTAIKFGLVGLTKYIRKSPFLYNQGKLKSKTAGSNQIWNPVSNIVPSATTGPVNNQYILWGPENLVS